MTRCLTCRTILHRGSYCIEHQRDANEQARIRAAYLATHPHRCEVCGRDRSPHELDLDHIDGNHHNNRPENHRLRCKGANRGRTTCKATTY